MLLVDSSTIEVYDLVLISPPSRMINHFRPPVALLYIGGYLQKKGLKVKIIDVPMKSIVRNKKFCNNISEELLKIENQMINKLKEIKTLMVGITFYTPEYFEVFKLARACKKINPKIKIIVGGIHPTLYSEEILEEKNCPIDFVVIGEGEITTYELIKAIREKRKSYKNINGIAYLNSDNNIIRTNIRPICDNIDDISYPAYDLIDMNYYTSSNPYAIRGCFLRSMYILATRGCPSSCTFCVAKKLRNYTGSRKFSRFRSAKSIIDEIQILREKYKIDSFYFIDDLFTINKKNVIEFCREIKKKNINLLQGCSSKVSTLDEITIKSMAEAGCVQIDFGVERGSDKALRLIKKGIKIEKIKEIFELCNRYNIRTFANFLVNLPEETEKDLDDIVNLMNVINPEIVSINIFTPYPGTEIYDNTAYKFTKSEYPLLTSAPNFIEMYPEKFKFSKHKINILKWTQEKQKKYNKFSKNVKFYLCYKYWKTLIKSKNKINYIKNIYMLIQEFINQKF